MKWQIAPWNIPRPANGRARDPWRQDRLARYCSYVHYPITWDYRTVKESGENFSAPESRRVPWRKCRGEGMNRDNPWESPSMPLGAAIRKYRSWWIAGAILFALAMA